MIKSESVFSSSPHRPLRVLIVGGHGFIGAAVGRALAARACQVTVGSRRAGPGEVAIDFAALPAPDQLKATLSGFDVLINAVGILTEAGTQDFAAVHASGPRQLFAAARAAGVRRVIQISALGADRGDTGYFRSKRSADDALAASGLEWAVVWPSLVFGRGGASAGMFTALATLPLQVLPEGGKQPLQPIHVDDLAAAIAELACGSEPPNRTVELVGPEVLSLGALLAAYRQALGFGRPLVLPVPRWMMAIAARAGELIPGSPITRETLSMLSAGNVGGPDALATTRALLGRTPRPPARFLDDDPDGWRWQAVSRLLRPLFQLVLAVIWLTAAFVSVAVWPREQSLEWLARCGIHGPAAIVALYSAAAIDAAFGVASLVWPRRWLWGLQAAVVLAYSGMLTYGMPELWGHPFGPLVKNLAILALLAALPLVTPPRQSAAH